MYNVIRLVFIFTIIFQLPHLVICQDDENDFNIIVINTGDKPECISCGTLYDPKIDNFLKIDAIASSDLIIKIMNNTTDECARSVFIRGGDVYYINHIPEGIYYLKIAYGYDLSKKVEENNCYAKFMRDVHYQVGNDLLDFYIKEYSDGYQIPNYALELKVISNKRNNEFDADNISEEEFYR